MGSARSSLSSVVVRRCCGLFRFLGLDGIDHLGLGGALRRAWTVFRYGIHNCTIAGTLSHPILYFTLPPSVGVSCLVSSIFEFFYELHRIWIICSRVRHYRSTSRSKSCSTVTRTRRVVYLQPTIIVPTWARSRTTTSPLAKTTCPCRIASAICGGCLLVIA